MYTGLLQEDLSGILLLDVCDPISSISHMTASSAYRSKACNSVYLHWRSLRTLRHQQCQREGGTLRFDRGYSCSLVQPCTGLVVSGSALDIWTHVSGLPGTQRMRPGLLRIPCHENERGSRFKTDIDTSAFLKSELAVGQTPVAALGYDHQLFLFCTGKAYDYLPQACSLCPHFKNNSLKLYPELPKALDFRNIP